MRFRLVLNHEARACDRRNEHVREHYAHIRYQTEESGILAEIYLAFYKGTGPSFYDRMVDGAIRLFTKGEYSHVELAVKKDVTREDGSVATVYECYSSSPRDGGVRVKEISVDNPEQWLLCKLNFTDEEKIKAYYEKTKGKKYDLRGALGVVLGFRQKKNRYFCSEWCFNALEDSEDGWRFSPNHLEAVFRNADLFADISNRHDNV